MKKTSLLLGVILIVAFNTPLAFTQSTTIIVPDDFSTIQEAVNAANPGDTIYVRAGTYHEIVTINKNNLALTGENKHTTIIDGGGGTDRTVLVDNADNVEINGLTIQNSYDGIYLYDSSFGTVSGNIITTCASRGIILSCSSFITISGNTLTSNHDGIELYKSSFITISGNTITNSRFGIGISSSFGNTFSENTITNSEDGLYIWNSSYTTASGNTITNSASRGISLSNSSYCNVSENTITFSAIQGILLSSSFSNTISENTLTSNYAALQLYRSSYATVSGNNITNNSHYGIYLYQSSDNMIFHNSFINNTIQVEYPGIDTTWDGGYPSGGNYWSDHVCAGNPSNGSQPYIIDANNIDHYPFQDPNGWINTLTIYSAPAGVTFTVNDVSRTTPWSGIYSEGTSVSLVMSEIHTFGDARYYWSQWGDENTSRLRTVTMTTNITLTAYYTGPYYELTVTSSPITGITFIINGTSQTTPYTEWLPEGSYTLIMPETDDGYVWSHWLEDGDTNRTKTVTMDTNITLTAVFTPPDTTPPTISIVSPENKTYTVDDVPLTFAVSETTSWMGYSLDGQMNVTISDNTTIVGLSNGAHTITVYANDTAGNMGYSDTVYFTIDTVPPNIEILSPENKTYTTSSVPLRFTVDEATLWIGYSLDGQANLTIAGNTTLTGLSDGMHTLVVYASDIGGNIGSSDMVYFAIDTTPPSISIASPENKTYDTTDISLTFTIDESALWMTYSLDNKANVTIAGNTTLSGLSDGSHSLIVYANDTAGNTGASQIIYFSIKTKAKPFPTWIAAAIVIIAVVGVALLVYFVRVKKTTEKNK